MTTSRARGNILIVDDTPANLQLLAGMLREHGYTVRPAPNGPLALRAAASNPPDLILLDINMPEMNGYEVCKRLKEEERTRDIPIIFISALNETDNKVLAFKSGGVDYVTKPFQFEEVQARVNTHLELARQRHEIERLLESILPRKVIKDLREKGESTPELFKSVTILFSDIVGFTEMTSLMPPAFLIDELNEVYTRFDEIVEEMQCERIKTVGDAYIAACGMPQPNSDHAKNAVVAALKFMEFLSHRNEKVRAEGKGHEWEVRIGLHSGEAVGGIVGTTKYVYDIFGDAVNTASRVQSTCEPSRVAVSQSTYELLKGDFQFHERGPIELKGKGRIPLFYVEST